MISGLFRIKILFTSLTEKKKLLWANKEFVYINFINKLSWYHPKITYENIVQKDMNKFLVYFITLCHEWPCTYLFLSNSVGNLLLNSLCFFHFSSFCGPFFINFSLNFVKPVNQMIGENWWKYVINVVFLSIVISLLTKRHFTHHTT